MCPHNLRVGVLQIQIDFELIRFGSFLDGKRHASAIKLIRGRFGRGGRMGVMSRRCTYYVFICVGRK